MTYEEAVRKHGGIGAAARAAGIPKSTFRDRLLKERAGNAVPSLALGSVGHRRTGRRRRAGRLETVTEEELLVQYDPYEKARARMATIPALIEEGAFAKDYAIRKALGLSGETQLFRELAEDPEMELLQYQFYLGRGSKRVLLWTDAATKQRMLAEHPLITEDIIPKPIAKEA